MLRNSDAGSHLPPLSRPADQVEGGDSGGRDSEWGDGLRGGRDASGGSAGRDSEWSGRLRGERNAAGGSTGRDAEWSGGRGAAPGGSGGREAEWQRVGTNAGSSAAGEAGARQAAGMICSIACDGGETGYNQKAVTIQCCRNLAQGVPAHADITHMSNRVLRIFASTLKNANERVM